MKIKLWPGILAVCYLLIAPGAALSDRLEQQRNEFLLAEKLISQDKQEAFVNLSLSLSDYPLYPYLQYQWLKNHLSQTDTVQAFLATYKGSRYAGLLRRKWLAYLAEQQRWHEFMQHYQASSDTALECQFNWAKYKAGNEHAALNAAKRLWVVGYSLPKACDDLMSALIRSPVFSQDLIWQRLELALKKDNVPLAEYVQRLLPENQQALAGLSLRVHKKPSLIQDAGLWREKGQRLGRIFAHGVDRMARSDLDSAILVWDGNHHKFNLDQVTEQQLERRLGMALASKKDKRAYRRLDRLRSADDEVREWKVRAALLEQDWGHVNDALSDLTPAQKQQPRWQYWQARALAKTGEALQARSVYSNLAQDRSFYGFLAADNVNKPYQLGDKPVSLAGNELAALAGESDFKVVQEFRLLGRDAEAQRQWWFAIQKLSKDKQMVAAKLAQQWQWYQVAVFTLAKTGYWDDLALRFPVNYASEVEDNAYRHSLDPAIVFGLIRQESVFDRKARSPVGARGLMQIMPKTGQQIARDLNEQWQSDNNLFNPEVNVKYGTYYFKQLLSRFKGHFALATAAYNAGPARVKSWLPSDETVPADIWIETIPFKETRKYVSSVLTYAMIYQQRIQRNAFKIKDFMRDVLPG